MSDLRTRVLMEFANKVIASRPHLAAGDENGSDVIGDAAAAVLRGANAIVDDAIRTYQRRAAPPAIPEKVTVEIDGDPDHRTQELTVTRPTAVESLEDRREWLAAIVAAVAAASSAQAQADALALREVASG